MSDDVDSRLNPESDRAEEPISNDQTELDPERVDLPPSALANSERVIDLWQVDYPLVNLAWVIEVLRQNLPPDDPAPTDLLRIFRVFEDYHIRLNDWNDLHNQLSDILFNYGQFSREVDRLADANEDPEPRTIGIHWHPVALKVAGLLDWASAPRSIFEGDPFARLQDRIVGPPWAVELCKSCDRLDGLTRPADLPRLFILPRDAITPRAQYVDINELYDAGSDFYDIAERWMYLVDRHVRKLTSELVDITRRVLKTLEAD